MNTTYVREIVVSYKGQRKKCSESLSDGFAVSKVFKKLLPDNSREHFLALYLNSANEVIAFSVVSTGTATNAPVHCREVFQPAILCGAVSIIVGHNHPGGQSMPSSADKEVTQKLKEAGNLLGIKLLDHVIVGDKNYYSFCENGAMY